MINLLIVDDELMIIRGLKETVSWHMVGINKIYTACNGKEAIDVLNEKKINIVITDVKMPLMNGLALIDYIYENYCDIKILIISGYDDFAYAKHAINKNVIDYLLKPVDIIELMNIVKKLTDEISKQEIINVNIIGKNHKSITESLEYLHKNYYKEITLSEVADIVYLSPNYFSALFKQVTGKSFSSYLNELRINKAKEFLTNTKDSIIDISQKVGYNDYKYFSRKFKEINGITPNNFRNK